MNRNKPGKPKGSPKTGGRKKGTPNRNSLRLREDLNALDFHLTQKFIDLYNDPATTTDQKLAILQNLSKYCFPVLKETTQLEAPAEPSAEPAREKPTDAEVLTLLRTK
jgi:hypothetical protein